MSAVESGGTFALSGVDRDGKIGSQLWINHPMGETNIHTSCSISIEVGQEFDGLFTVLAGTSRNNGMLCDGDTPPDMCEPPVCDPEVEECPVVCDPEVEECPVVCNPEVEECPVVCDPETEICIGDPGGGGTT